ncbi:MAG: GNAT family N-acetyltransferase [Chloroflexi bacterium]|nr:GNAT family N-acetyltransferase [Chloroflexota bacterium]
MLHVWKDEGVRVQPRRRSIKGCIGVRIRPFRQTDEEYAAVAAIVARAPVDELCDFEYGHPADLRAFDAGFDPDHLPRRYVAVAPDGAIVGYAHTFPTTWIAEPGGFWAATRVTAPYRRLTIGRQLLARALGEAHAAGGLFALSEVREQLADATDFAAQTGFLETMRSWELRLDTRTVDVTPLRRYVGRAEATGIRLVSLDALRASDPDWLPKLHELHRLLNRDVPLPDAPNITREWFARFALVCPAAFFVAVDGERYVGESFMHPAEGQPGTLNQRMTGVLRDYRGRGIAMALKVLTIEYAQTHGYDRISTWIESTNTSMLAISERLGFTRHPGLVVYRQDLT